MKKMISWIGALGILATSAYAATATVWTEEGVGEMEPAYWYTFKYGKGASVDTSTTAANVKLAEITATDSKDANGAGFGLTWKQNADYEDTPVSLGSYKGVCLSYRATAPFRLDFKQSTITDDNYYGADMPASAGAKTYLAFADLKQGWKSKTTVAWNAAKQLGIQFSYKSNLVTATQNSNTLEIVSIILGDECVTFPPELQAPYKTTTEMDLNEGDTLAFDMSKVFVDPDGEELAYTVTVTGDAKVADTLFNKTGIVRIITKSNPVEAGEVTIKATDPNKKSATWSFALNVVDRENAPVAVNDSYTTKEETKLSKSTIITGVMANDYDPDGDAFTAELVEPTAHGTLTFDGKTGGFVYTPEKDFFGVDEFTYQIVETKEDDPKTSNVGKVSITVTNVDDPLTVKIADSSLTVGEDTYTLSDTIVLAEDFDPVSVMIPLASIQFVDPDVAAGEAVAIKVKSSGIVKVKYAEFGTDHVIDLEPIADANGVAKVTMFVVDGKDTASVSFNVKVTPVADPPVAVADAYEMLQDTVNAVTAKKGVLANDKNPDNAKSALTAVLLEDGTYGKVTLAEDGSFTYEAPKEEGEDTFVYAAVNAEGDTSEPVIVTLTVVYRNLAPKVLAGVADTVGNRLAALKEDFTGAKKFSNAELHSWFEDDLDEPAKLTFTARSDDSLLATTMNNAGLFVSAVKNACGEATVVLVATDTKGASTELLIPAMIECTNDKPVPAKVQDTIYIGVGAWADTINLYDYVSDPDGDSLTFTVTSNKVIDQKFDWELDGYNLIVSTKDSTYLDKGGFVTFGVKAADSLTYASFNLMLLAKDDPKSSIKPVIAAAPKTSWQNAILANRGAVALFDMQGRVMWKAKLPVSEADVRNAAAQVQGRKILQVNKQTWTIK